MTDFTPVPAWAFQTLYGVASLAVMLFAVQAFRYAARCRGWGPWVFAAHMAAKVAFVLDLFLLRTVWRGDASEWHGLDGWLTFGVRFAWVVTLIAVVVAARRGAILREAAGDAAGWDGAERRTFVRRAADREAAS